MADSFQLELATPERLLVKEQVTQVEVPAKSGYLGILAGHAPLLARLGAGVLTFEGGKQGAVAVAGGFVEVFDNHVRVLADYAQFAKDVDAGKARQDLEHASEALKKADTERSANEALEAAQSAQARLDAAGR